MAWHLFGKEGMESSILSTSSSENQVALLVREPGKIPGGVTCLTSMRM